MMFQTYLLILLQADPIIYEITGQILIKFILYLTFFLLIGMMYLKLEKKT